MEEEESNEDSIGGSNGNSNGNDTDGSDDRVDGNERVSGGSKGDEDALQIDDALGMDADEIREMMKQHTEMSEKLSC